MANRWYNGTNVFFLIRCQHKYITWSNKELA